jgi:hypothetical protein
MNNTARARAIFLIRLEGFMMYKGNTEWVKQRIGFEAQARNHTVSGEG